MTSFPCQLDPIDERGRLNKYYLRHEQNNAHHAVINLMHARKNDGTS